MDDISIIIDYCVGYGDRNDDLFNDDYFGYSHGDSYENIDCTGCGDGDFDEQGFSDCTGKGIGG